MARSHERARAARAPEAERARAMPAPMAASLFCAYLGVNLGALLLATRSQRQPRRYLNSSAVTLSELLKFLCSVLAVYAASPSRRAAVHKILRTLLLQPTQLLLAAVPALLYIVQNNIITAAFAHLDVVTFQITYQLKIVAALLSSRLLLKTRPSALRWLSVALLTVGVILVQLSLTQEPDADEDESQRPQRNRLLGLTGVLVACACSGLAGAVMELLLKRTALPLAERYMQVSAVSLLLATALMLANDLGALRASGFFQGYDALVCATVALDSLGGLLVAMLLKVSTATLKNFAAPVGVILNCLLSAYVFRSSSFRPTRRFLAGAALVALALGMHAASA